jgi:hypothetical protein
MAALVAWALVASVGFGWAWVMDQQHQASIRGTINLIILDMGTDFLSASAATRSLLAYKSLGDGWNASIWLDEVRHRVGGLAATNEGLTILQALNLTFGGGLDCSWQAYVNILALAASNPSLLNGTTPYTVYFGTAESLTASLGHNLWNITGKSRGATVQLGSPSATAIRDGLASLHAASKPYGGSPC